MNWEICIGQVFDIELQTTVPKRKIIINQSQKNIITSFANKGIDKDGRPIYNINGCEFTLQLCFDFDLPYYMQRQEEAEIEAAERRKAKKEAEKKEENITPTV